MATLINKANPQIRITAPEIGTGTHGYYYVDSVGYHKDKWTLVEEEPKKVNCPFDKGDCRYCTVQFCGARKELQIETHSTTEFNAFKAGAEWMKKQKPVEWSEEDEAMRDNILRLLSCFVGTLECDSNPSLSTSYPAYQREIDWLKSLHPQSKVEEEPVDD